ncbi:replication initiator [Streptomyces sp. NPDC005279]|uniref:replication initiator n=1 Tax=Streptomyces sp. NPDC005279 TaxID=3364712 RepID=UPI0036893E45
MLKLSRTGSPLTDLLRKVMRCDRARSAGLADGHPELPDHTRRLIEPCWDLDAAYPERLPAHWSHMPGFRGHFSTRAPRYSSTLRALRGAGAEIPSCCRRDLDLDAGALRVRRNVAELHSGRRLVKESESAAGKRTVEFSSVTLADLATHLAVFAEPGPDPPARNRRTGAVDRPGGERCCRAGKEARSRAGRARSGHTGRIEVRKRIRARLEDEPPAWP